jgi:hypothetical protein
MGNVRDILDSLTSGNMDLAEAAVKFAHLSWEKTTPAAGYHETIASDLTGRPWPGEGSWYEVELAFNAGRITADQYRVLATAASAGMHTAG